VLVALEAMAHCFLICLSAAGVIRSWPLLKSCTLMLDAISLER
jgi:hypothetical protein